MDDSVIRDLREIIDEWRDVSQEVYILDNVLRARPAYVSLTYMERDGREVPFLNGAEDFGSSYYDAGFLINVFLGDKKQGFGGSYASRSQLPRDREILKSMIFNSMDDAYKAALSSYLKIVSDGIDVQNDLSFSGLSKEESHHHVEERADKSHFDDIIFDSIRRWTEKAKNQPHIAEANSVFRQTEGQRCFVDSEGREILDNSSQKSIDTLLDVIHEDSYVISSGDSLSFTNERNTTKDRLGLFLEKILEHSSELKDAVIPESDQYPVIFDHGAAGTLFHEALGGHLLSGKYIIEGTSTAFKNKLEKMILPEFLSIVDNPENPDYFGHYKYDAEGIPGKKVTLVENGVLKNYLLDRNSAFHMGTSSNGHSRLEWVYDLEGNTMVPEPRVSNLEITSLRAVPDEELHEIASRYCRDNNLEHYIFLDSGEGCVLPETTEFRLMPLRAWRFTPEGKKEPITNFFVVGNAYELLKQIYVTGKTPGSGYGICGAGSGGVATQEVSPQIFVPKVNIQSYEQERYTERLLPMR